MSPASSPGAKLQRGFSGSAFSRLMIGWNTFRSGFGTFQIGFDELNSPEKGAAAETATRFTCSPKGSSAAAMRLLVGLLRFPCSIGWAVGVNVP